MIKYENNYLGMNGPQHDLQVVARLDDRVVGFISYTIYNEEIHIKHTEVAPDFRRQGIATAMYRLMESENPGLEVHSGMRTDEGDALWKSLKNKQAMKRFCAKSKLQRSQNIARTCWDMIINILNRMILRDELQGFDPDPYTARNVEGEEATTLSGLDNFTITPIFQLGNGETLNTSIQVKYSTSVKFHGSTSPIRSTDGGLFIRAMISLPFDRPEYAEDFFISGMVHEIDHAYQVANGMTPDGYALPNQDPETLKAYFTHAAEVRSFAAQFYQMIKPQIRQMDQTTFNRILENFVVNIYALRTGSSVAPVEYFEAMVSEIRNELFRRFDLTRKFANNPIHS